MVGLLEFIPSQRRHFIQRMPKPEHADMLLHKKAALKKTGFQVG
jgi:hypothetical protein